MSFPCVVRALQSGGPCAPRSLSVERRRPARAIGVSSPLRRRDDGPEKGRAGFVDDARLKGPGRPRGGPQFGRPAAVRCWGTVEGTATTRSKYGVSDIRRLPPEDTLTGPFAPAFRSRPGEALVDPHPRPTRRRSGADPPAPGPGRSLVAVGILIGLCRSAARRSSAVGPPSRTRFRAMSPKHDQRRDRAEAVQHIPDGRDRDVAGARVSPSGHARGRYHPRSLPVVRGCYCDGL